MPHRDNRNRAIASFSRSISMVAAAAALIGLTALPRMAAAGDVPTFAVDAS